MVCLATHLNYKLNLHAQALLDLDHLVQEARKNSYPSVDIQFIVDSLNVNCLPLLLKSEAISLILFLCSNQKGESYDSRNTCYETRFYRRCLLRKIRNALALSLGKKANTNAIFLIAKSTVLFHVITPASTTVFPEDAS